MKKKDNTFEVEDTYVNAKEAMKIKLQILKIFGFSEHLIDLYCPEFPEINEKEIIDEDWLYNFFRQCDRYLHFVSNHNDFNHNDIRIFSHFCSSYLNCPYCSANNTKNRLQCDKCSYGKKYGICDDVDSNWNKLRNICYKSANDKRGDKKYIINEINKIKDLYIQYI